MTPDQARWLVLTDPDFCHSKRHGYSMAELEKQHPDGCPDRVVAQALMLREEEVEARYGEVVLRLRRFMGIGSVSSGEEE